MASGCQTQTTQADEESKEKEKLCETIEEESDDEPPPNTRGQVVFDPPYNLLKYPKKYKRDDMGVMSGWPGFLILALLIGGFSYITYSPDVPEWAGDRFLLQCYVSATRITQLVSLSVPYLTGFRVTYTESLRWILEMFFSNYIPENDAWVGVTDASFDGVPVKIFRPRTAENDSPAVVFIHGGGWSLLSANSYSASTYYMAWKLNMVVVSIDYRLAPEHPYPLPLEDCVKATVYFLRKAVKYDVDPNRIAIAGDSAGGNLAAAVTLKLTQDSALSQLPSLKLQVLIYPAVQVLNFNTYSYNAFSHTGFLSKDQVIDMWLNYMGFPELHAYRDQFAANNHTSQKLKKSALSSYVKHDILPELLREKDFQHVGTEGSNDTLAAKVVSRLTDPYFAPLMAKDLSKVPPAYMILSQNDPIRDDGFFYADRLRKAGVKLEVDFHSTMAHGFCLLSPSNFLTFQEGKEAYDKMASHIQKVL